MCWILHIIFAFIYFFLFFAEPTNINKDNMQNVRQVIAPIVTKGIRGNIFYLYVSFLSHFSIEIVSQKMVILSSLSQKLVTGFFPTVSFMTDAKILLSATLPHSHTLFLRLSCCLPVSPSFRSSINITRVCILDYYRFDNKSLRTLKPSCLISVPSTQ